jgi:hypothetical protein
MRGRLGREGSSLCRHEIYVECVGSGLGSKFESSSEHQREIAPMSDFCYFRLSADAVVSIGYGHQVED